MLCDPQDKLYDHNNIKVLQLHNGWLRLKFTSIRDSQSGNYPVKIMCSNEELKVFKELDYVCVDALIASLSEKLLVDILSGFYQFVYLLDYLLANIIGNQF
jgi:hypothetical protein